MATTVITVFWIITAAILINTIRWGVFNSGGGVVFTIMLFVSFCASLFVTTKVTYKFLDPKKFRFEQVNTLLKQNQKMKAVYLFQEKGKMPKLLVVKHANQTVVPPTRKATHYHYFGTKWTDIEFVNLE